MSVVVTVNGMPRALAEATTLGELVEREVAQTRGSAAAVDGVVVPRAQWARCQLHDGEAIEILTAVQGG